MRTSRVCWPIAGAWWWENISDDPFEYDVQRRVPAVDKAEKVLGFTATTSLDVMLDEVIPWIEEAVAQGRI